MKFGFRRSTATEHQYVEERLSALLDGELSPQEQSAVERHLAACPRCRWDLDTLRQTVQWTKELPTLPAPRVFTIPAPAQPVRASRPRWNFVPVLQGATALVALLLLFVVAGDILLTGQAPALRERAPVAVQATYQVEAEKAVVEQTQAVEPAGMAIAETGVAERAVAEAPPPPAPGGTLPPEAAPVEEVTAPTVAPEGGEMDSRLDAAEMGKEAEATADGTPHPPTVTATATATAAATATYEPTPTLAPPELPLPAAPTTVAEIPAPGQGGAEGAGGALRGPDAAWLRVTEWVLSALLVLLGAITVAAMRRRRRDT